MVLIFFLVGVALLIIIRYTRKDIWDLLIEQFEEPKPKITDTVRLRIHGYLNENPYFIALSPSAKNKFIDRTWGFMNDKEFISRSGLEVTEEMCVLISSSAIQLTFGLEYYKLEYLKRIFVHPDTFQLSERSPEYKGATSGHVMHLSWKAFKDGYRISDDNLNLGLHEMTHALKLALYLGKQFDEVFATRMEHWEELLQEKYKSFIIKPNFLRKYSKTNTEEFFAVCVEAFFESPEKFKRELPEIYQSLVFLLNQDMLNKKNDYLVREGYFTGNAYQIPESGKVKISYKYSSTHWSVGVLIFGTFSFTPTIIVSSNTFIFSVQYYFLMAACLGTIGLFQKRYFEERKIFSGIHFYLYSYFGFGMSLTTILLWLNFFIPVSKTYEGKFSVVNYNNYHIFKDLSSKPDHQMEHQLFENDRLFFVKNSPGGRYLVFKYHYGILGIKKVEDYYFTGEIKPEVVNE